MLKKISISIICLGFMPFAYPMNAAVKQIPSLCSMIISKWASECIKNDLSYTADLERRIMRRIPHAIVNLRDKIIASDSTHFFCQLAPATWTALIGHKSPITLVALSPTGTFALTASEDMRICLWDLTSTKPLCTILDEIHKAPIIALAFSSDGESILSVSSDCIARLIQIREPKKSTIINLNLHPEINASVVYFSHSYDTQKAIAVLSNKRIYLWNLKDHRVRALEHHPEQNLRALISPDGAKVLFFSSTSNVVSIFNFEKLLNDDTQTPVHFAPPSSGTTNASFSADSRCMLFANNEGVTFKISLADALALPIDQSTNCTDPHLLDQKAKQVKLVVEGPKMIGGNS